MNTFSTYNDLIITDAKIYLEVSVGHHEDLVDFFVAISRTNLFTETTRTFNFCYFFQFAHFFENLKNGLMNFFDTLSCKHLTGKINYLPKNLRYGP